MSAEAEGWGYLYCLVNKLNVTRRIFAFTRALCLGETLVLLDVVSQGLLGNLGVIFFSFLCESSA